MYHTHTHTPSQGVAHTKGKPYTLNPQPSTLNPEPGQGVAHTKGKQSQKRRLFPPTGAPNVPAQAVARQRQGQGRRRGSGPWATAATLWSAKMSKET